MLNPLRAEQELKNELFANKVGLLADVHNYTHHTCRSPKISICGHLYKSFEDMELHLELDSDTFSDLDVDIGSDLYTYIHTYRYLLYYIPLRYNTSHCITMQCIAMHELVLHCSISHYIGAASCSTLPHNTLTHLGKPEP